MAIVVLKIAVVALSLYHLCENLVISPGPRENSAVCSCQMQSLFSPDHTCSGAGTKKLGTGTDKTVMEMLAKRANWRGAGLNRASGKVALYKMLHCIRYEV
ncbi:hypothetical protein GOODEAATRI_032549 [Goodea atripinnis]|uniref:Secreted protein n=1 Tax=Goodea atripinnis TaxID=208336 RepID=A0ABV0P9K4_9TELE